MSAYSSPMANPIRNSTVRLGGLVCISCISLCPLIIWSLKWETSTEAELRTTPIHKFAQVGLSLLIVGGTGIEPVTSSV